MTPSAPEHKIIFFSLIIGAVIFLILGGIVFSELLKKEHTATIQNDPITEPATIVEITAPPVTSEDQASVENNLSPAAENKSLPEPASPDKPPAVSPKASASFPGAVHQLVSWGFTSAAARQIDTVIIHSSYNALGGNVYDLEKLLLEYKQYAVAPHYLIDREGAVFVLVPESKVAFHAGAGEVPDGRKEINNFSVGIELMNTEKDAYTAEQYTALNKLLAYLKNKYTLKYILGHNQVAPERKTDPWNLDWKKVDKDFNLSK